MFRFGAGHFLGPSTEKMPALFVTIGRGPIAGVENVQPRFRAAERPESHLIDLYHTCARSPNASAGDDVNARRNLAVGACAPPSKLFRRKSTVNLINYVFPAKRHFGYAISLASYLPARRTRHRGRGFIALYVALVFAIMLP